MKCINTILWLILIAVLHSCNTDRDNDIQHRSFENTKQLQGEEILTDLFAPLKPYPIDSLILFSVRKHSSFFKVYGSDLVWMSDFANKGSQAEAWNMPAFHGQYSKENDKRLIWLNEINKHKLYQINLTPSLLDSQKYITKEVAYPKDHDLSHYAFYLSDSLILAGMGNSTYSPCRLQFFNLRTGELRQIPAFPSLEGKMEANPDFYYDAYFSRLSIQPDKQLIVSVMEKFDRIDLFNYQGELLRSIGDQKNGHDLYLGEGQAVDFTLYYTDIATTSNHIYALYLNQPDSQYGSDITSPCEIHVFNWGLEPLHKFTVDEYLLSIGVDEQHGYLYGVDFYNEKNMRYQLPNSLY